MKLLSTLIAAVFAAVSFSAVAADAAMAPMGSMAPAATAAPAAKKDDMKKDEAKPAKKEN